MTTLPDDWMKQLCDDPKKNAIATALIANVPGIKTQQVYDTTIALLSNLKKEGYEVLFCPVPDNLRSTPDDEFDSPRHSTWLDDGV